MNSFLVNSLEGLKSVPSQENEFYFTSSITDKTQQTKYPNSSSIKASLEISNLSLISNDIVIPRNEINDKAFIYIKKNSLPKIENFSEEITIKDLFHNIFPFNIPKE